MHCRDLVQLAALVALHGPALIRSGRVSRSGVQQYWTASKRRLDRWTGCLKDYLLSHAASTDFPASSGTTTLAWQRVRPIVEESLASEVLTRVWSAVACAYDRRRGIHEIEPIVRIVYVGHLDARNRALNALVYGRGIGQSEAVELNRLRRRCERWCDLLLGHLAADELMTDFAFDANRSREFARDLREDQNSMAAEFVLSSLRDAFDDGMSNNAASADLNQQVAAAILSSFGSELFDSACLPGSLWLERLRLVATDAQEMIEDLLRIEVDPGTPSPTGP